MTLELWDKHGRTSFQGGIRNVIRSRLWVLSMSSILRLCMEHHGSSAVVASPVTGSIHISVLCRPIQLLQLGRSIAATRAKIQPQPVRHSPVCLDLSLSSSCWICLAHLFFRLIPFCSPSLSFSCSSTLFPFFLSFPYSQTEAVFCFTATSEALPDSLKVQPTNFSERE